MAEEVSECHSESWEELNSEEGTSASTTKKHIPSKVCLKMICLFPRWDILLYISIYNIYYLYLFSFLEGKTWMKHGGVSRQQIGWNMLKTWTKCFFDRLRGHVWNMEGNRWSGVKHGVCPQSHKRLCECTHLLIGICFQVLEWESDV